MGLSEAEGHQLQQEERERLLRDEVADKFYQAFQAAESLPGTVRMHLLYDIGDRAYNEAAGLDSRMEAFAQRVTKDMAKAAAKVFGGIINE